MNTKTTQTTPGKTSSGQTTAGKVKDDEAANIPGLVTSLAETEKKTKKPKKKKCRPSLKVFTPQTPDASVHQWFFTLMCMNIPIIGWFYLVYLAFNKKNTSRRNFARAYMFYKLLFLLLAAAILGALVYIGMEIADQLLAYMEML